MLGITLQIREIRTADDLPAAFDAGDKERAEGWSRQLKAYSLLSERE